MVLDTVVVGDKSQASLCVRVQDRTGYRIPWARVVLRDLNKAASTGENGTAVFIGLPPGEHQVIVQYMGYQEYVDTLRFIAGIRESLMVEMVERPPSGDIDLPASELDPAFGMKRRFHPHFGLVYVEPAGPLLVATRDTIAAGTKVTALFLDGTSRARALRVTGRMGQNEVEGLGAPFLAGPSELHYFRLEWVQETDAVRGRGLGVIDARSKPSGGAWRARLDVDGDGRREELWACDEDSYLRVWVREASTGWIVWGSLCKPGPRLPPPCKPVNVW